MERASFLLSESVVNVIIKNVFIYVTLFFPRHAQPSKLRPLPVKEAVSVYEVCAKLLNLLTRRIPSVDS